MGMGMRIQREQHPFINTPYLYVGEWDIVPQGERWPNKIPTFFKVFKSQSGREDVKRI